MSYQEELLLLVNKLGLSKSVTFEHYTIDKSKIYRDAYLMLMTSRNEGWGIVIDEAMSYGVPVISYDTSYGPSEIITDNQDGYIIPIGDIDQMADKAIHLLKNKKVWNNFSKKSIKNISRFSLNPVSHQWRNIIEKIKSQGIK